MLDRLMQVITPDFVRNKKVILRMDLDVPITNGVVAEDLRLRVGLPTLQMCFQNAEKVTIIGHLGRPEGADPKFSLHPVYYWFLKNTDLPMAFNDDNSRVNMLENTRFNKEEKCGDKNSEFARELSFKGDVYVNEAFASHNESVSTTILPQMLPHAAGLRFAEEVERLTQVRKNPKKPLVAIIGGAKVEDKYESLVKLSEFVDTVLVGGLLAKKIVDGNLKVSPNVKLATMSENGFDISDKSIQEFAEIIQEAQAVVWAGPVGKYEDPEGQAGDKALAQVIIDSGVESIIGGGDTITALREYLPKFIFVSTGGGAMLELLSKGTLPTIEALA